MAEVDPIGRPVAARPGVCDANGMHRFHVPHLLAAVLILSACHAKPVTDPKGSGTPRVVLAQVDDITITDADLKELLARYASQPFVLARYSSIEKKKELLDSLVRYDVLAIEARKRGYERDPEVQRVAKDKMVKLFTQQEIFEKVKPADVPDADVEKYYKEHASEYVRPETVRASQILVKERAKAVKILAEVKALQRSDMKAFRDLVAKYSDDADSRPRGGDLTQFDRASTQHPPSVVAAAFALKEVGEVSELVATDKGFAVLKLTDKRPALSRSLEEARPEIQRRLLDELRAKRKKDYVEEARKTIKVEIFEDQLAKLDLAGSAAAAGGPGATLPQGAQRPGVDAGGMVGNRP
jgi:peptidyl-prolyl cis-trans isomerase C